MAQLLLDSGAACSVPCFDEAEQKAFELTDHPKVFTKANIDLTDEDQTQSFYKDAVAEQGPLWGSIHLAGGFGMGKIADTLLSDFMKQFQLNTVSCYNACRAAVQWMRGLFRRTHCQCGCTAGAGTTAG